MQNIFSKSAVVAGATLAALSLGAHQAQAQTVVTYYNFANATTSSTPLAVSPTSGSSSTFKTDSFFSDLGNTIPAGTNTVGSYIVTDTATSATNGQSFSIIPGTAATHYVEFSTTLTGQSDPGLILSYATMRSSTGAILQTITYSTDSTFTSNVLALGTFTVPTAYGLASFSLAGLGLENSTVPEYFRITSSGGTGTSGTNRYDNVFIGVPAAPAAAPEPSSVVSMIVGMGILGLIAARRRSVRSAV